VNAVEQRIIRCVIGRCLFATFLFVATLESQTQESLTPVKVEMLTRAVSKTPVLIAYDKGLYKKYGLDVKLWMPPAEYPGAVETPGKMENPDFSVDGGVPMVTDILANRLPRRLAIASTDCQVRFSVIGQKTMRTLDDLKGKRLGVSNDGAMTGFIYRELDRRMNWTPGKDIIIVEQAQRFEDLKAGKADAFVADERYMALAKKEGYPVLADTSAWKQPIAGNSVRVEWNWIRDPKNRDLATRFLKATIEGLAVYFNSREEAVRVLSKYHGIADRDVANSIYQQGLKMSRKMEPCIQGFKEMFTLGYPGLEKYKPADFFDDSFVKELDRTGFIAAAYKKAN